MRNTTELDCPPEVLLGLHLNAEQFRDKVKHSAAVAMFRDGQISSGVAARWLGISRAQFLFEAMKAGAELLEDSTDDYVRERALL